MSFEWSRNLGAVYPGIVSDVGSLTGFLLNSAYTFETSGDAWACNFISPVDQTSGALTLYVYCTATAGTPPQVQVECRNGSTSTSEPDRPEAAGSTIGTPGSAATAAANTWLTLSLSGLTLAAGSVYWLIVDNIDGSPGTNTVTIANRPALDGWSNNSPFYTAFRTGSTTAGFSADPSISTAIGACVVKFDDGSVIGNPYMRSNTHTSNANDRGNRLNFSEDVVVSGAIWAGLTSTAVDFAIYQGASAQVTVTLSPPERQRLGMVRFAPITLTGGTDYDVVWSPGASTSTGIFYDMGAGTVPADVIACRPGGNLAYVDGATPGSYTADNESMYVIALIADDGPAIAGGGAPGHATLTGGMQ